MAVLFAAIGHAPLHATFASVRPAHRGVATCAWPPAPAGGLEGDHAPFDADAHGGARAAARAHALGARDPPP
eukprot:13590025-Alexandrium_andersonii.AAC.1